MNAVDRHGTVAGWSRHKRAGETPCDACTRAREEYDARRRAASTGQAENRRNARAQHAALKELRHRHLEEYRALYEVAKREMYQ